GSTWFASVAPLRPPSLKTVLGSIVIPCVVTGSCGIVPMNSNLRYWVLGVPREFMNDVEAIVAASIKATNEILSSKWAKRHGFVINAQISKGACEKWADAVVKRLHGSEKEWIHGGHCMVVWKQFWFDSDTSY